MSIGILNFDADWIMYKILIVTIKNKDNVNKP